MDKDLEGICRPVYRNLWIYWLMLLLGTVLGLSDSTLITVIALIPVIIELYQLYLMRTVSDGLEQAFRWNIAGMTIAVAGLVLALLALGSVLAVLLVLAALGGVIVTVIADYYFYSALDELAAVRGYAYPAGRIKWCFWLSLIGAVAAAVLDAAMPGADTVVGLVIQAVILVLLWQYLRAVKQNEEGADSGLNGPDDPLA